MTTLFLQRSHPNRLQELQDIRATGKSHHPPKSSSKCYALTRFILEVGTGGSSVFSMAMENSRLVYGAFA